VSPPWFDAAPVQESFFDTAPQVLREVFDVPRPAAEVWGDLTSQHPLSWCRILRRVRWTSARPFGVGTTRTVRSIAGAMLRERYFVWEEGRRHAFYVTQTTLPVFRALAEDYLVEPVGEDACRFTWTIAIEPRPLTEILNPANRLLLGTLFQDTRKHYASG
jgi:Polyketide cyclase / dehydrase and lipid transport